VVEALATVVVTVAAAVDDDTVVVVAAIATRAGIDTILLVDAHTVGPAPAIVTPDPAPARIHAADPPPWLSLTLLGVPGRCRGRHTESSMTDRGVLAGIDRIRDLYLLTPPALYRVHTSQTAGGMIAMAICGGITHIVLKGSLCPTGDTEH